MSVAPRVYYASGLEGADPRCVVSIIGCTGDWFGGWDGLTPGDADRFITADLQQGRMVEVIEKEEPAVMVCHWPGIYFNGTELGFDIFKTVVGRLHARYDHLRWMKLSEIARYWAAKELTRIERQGHTVTFHAPFATPHFTVRVAQAAEGAPQVATRGIAVPLNAVQDRRALTAGTWVREGRDLTVCFDLPRGETKLRLDAVR